MIKIDGYNLYSFAIGCKHVRSFSLTDQVGTIADCILGECGAEGSPLPVSYYSAVSVAPDAVTVFRKNGAARMSATRDRLILYVRTEKLGEDLADHERLVRWADHLFPMVYEYLHEPKLAFVGMVWEFAQCEAPKRDRYQHPAAEAVWRRAIKVPLNPATEFPAEALARLTFRKRIPDLVVKELGKDDYLNVNLTFRDANERSLWKEDEDEEESDAVKSENPRLSVIAADVQRVFDPRREFDDRMMSTHWYEANALLDGRVGELLGAQVGPRK